MRFYASGIPLYGRSFLTPSGPGSNYNGVGAGSYEAGIYDYKSLPLPSSTVHHSPSLAASWSQSSTEFISFDTPEVVKQKMEYVKQEGLGGAMFWELSGDRKREEGGSLVGVVKDSLGELDKRENWLRYEGSKFDNLRKGMM